MLRAFRWLGRLDAQGLVIASRMDVCPAVAKPSRDWNIEADVAKTADLWATVIYQLDYAHEIMSLIPPLCRRRTQIYVPSHSHTGCELRMHPWAIFFHSESPCSVWLRTSN